MNKSDLTIKMYVEQRCGLKIKVNSYEWELIADSYNEDLTHQSNVDFDIIKVYIITEEKQSSKLKIVWEREEK